MSQDPHALNPRQREAVLHGDGPLLILAGAGTGKTRTLAYRIAYLVERGVAPGTILAVAFTNKSADELKERVKKLLRKGAKAPSVSTFHSFCVRVLRSEIEHLGYKRNFTIYDTADQLSALKEALREVRLVGRGDADAKRVLAAISRAKNEGREPDPGDGTDPYAILAAEAAPRYASALKAYNAVDFDDLLVFTLKLFREFPEVLERWRERCRHVLVDEFQDTNAVQYQLVSLLAGPGGNLTVVGDDDQSIYGWRGALPGNILDFTQRLADGEGDHPRSELPLHRPHPRGGEHRHPQELRAAREEPLERPRRGGAGHGAGLQGLRGRGERGRRAHHRPGRLRQGQARRLRRDLPHQRPVASVRGRAAPPPDALRRHRRDALLRPQGGARPGRLPAGDPQPARRDRPAAGRQLPGARGRQRNHPPPPGGEPRRKAAARRSHGERRGRPRGRRAPGARARGVPAVSRRRCASASAPATSPSRPRSWCGSSASRTPRATR